VNLLVASIIEVWPRDSHLYIFCFTEEPWQS